MGNAGGQGGVVVRRLFGLGREGAAFPAVNHVMWDARVIWMLLQQLPNDRDRFHRADARSLIRLHIAAHQLEGQKQTRFHVLRVHLQHLTQTRHIVLVRAFRLQVAPRGDGLDV